MKQYEYDAFISYRHCHLDQFVAENLHRKLESFRLPKSVIEQIPTGNNKISRVFRDLEELPITDNLTDPITKALENSKYLIIVCSPRLRESMWCRRELEIFLKTHDRSHVLLVLAEGEPSDSFPEIMTYEEIVHTNEDGTETIERKMMEPLAADARGNSKREILKALDVVVIRLAAAIFNVNYDDIKRRHREQILRTRIVWASCISIVLLIFSIVSIVLLTKITVQNSQLGILHAKSIAHNADFLIGRGRRMDALYAVRSVMSDDDYLSSESYRVMMSALDPYAFGTSFIATHLLDSNAPVSDFDVTNNGELVAVSDYDGNLKIFKVGKNVSYAPKPLASVRVDEALNTLPYFGFSGEKNLIYSDLSTLNLIDLQTKKISKISDKPGFVLVPRGLSDYVTVVVSGQNVEGYLGAEKKFSVTLKDIGMDITRFANLSFGFSDDGKYLSLYLSNWSGNNYLYHLNTETGVLELSLKLTVSGGFGIATDGRKIFAVSHIEKYADQKRANNILYVVDAKSGDLVWKKSIPLMSARNLITVNGNLLVTGFDGAVLLDTDHYSIISHTERIGDVLSGIKFKEEPYVPDYDGHLYLMNSIYEYGMDMTLTLFKSVPQNHVQKVLAAGDRLFYMYDNAFAVTIYENNPFALQNEKFVCSDQVNSEQIGCSVPVGTGFEYLDPDIKYFLVEYTDKSRKMTESEVFALKSFIARHMITSVHSVVYVPENDIYIIHGLSVSYILDSSLGEIISLKHVTIDALTDDRLILSKNGNRYSLPYLSKKQVIKMADEQLGNYVPNEQLMELLGIKKINSSKD